MSTLVREYRLPHCTLILEGFSTQVGGPLAVLVQVDCYLPGLDHPMRGGREFLEHLSWTVSEYVQRLLSYRQPRPVQPTGPVALEPVAPDRHRLRVHPELLQDVREPVQLELTTIQLFDLTEACDQGMSDPQTLPDWRLDLTPQVPRTVKLAQQAVPAGVGLATLGAAAMALAFLPAPKVEPPREWRETPAPETQASPRPSPVVTPSPPTPGPTPLASPATVLDPAEYNRLLVLLYDQLDKAWTQPVTQDLRFRVQVNREGKIVAFAPLDPPTGEEKRLPLATLQQPGVAVAEFQVVFRASGALEVGAY